VLSGGERARVLLARLLVRPTNALLMDEPTNHLDIARRRRWPRRSRLHGTLVFVSHNGSFINRLATKIWEIDGGQVVEHPGNLRDYLERRAAAEAKAAAPEPAREAGAATTRSPGPRSMWSMRRGRAREPDRVAARAQGAQARGSRRRNALAAQTRPLRRTIAELEQRIAALEAEQRNLEPQLAPSPSSTKARSGSSRCCAATRRTRQARGALWRWGASAAAAAGAGRANWPLTLQN